MRAIKLLAPIAVLPALLITGCGSNDGDESTQGTTTDAPAQTSGTPPPASPSGASPAGASAQACDTYAVDAQALRVTGVSCGEGRKTMFGWQRAESCRTDSNDSRGACTVGAYRCLATKVDRGVAVSCARPGRSIAFIAKR